MIQFPGNAPAREENSAALTAGTHTVQLSDIKFVAKVGKIAVEYRDPIEGAVFTDWLGFNSDAQSKRSYAYTCRLHDLAGLPAPKGGAFDEAQLLKAHEAVLMQITLVENDKGYLNMSDFPMLAGAAGSTTGEVLF